MRSARSISLRTWPAVLTLAIAIAVPAPGLAQPLTNPLSPGLPAATPTTTTAAPVTVAAPSTDTGLSGVDAIAIALGAFLLIAAISFFIWRDARRRAPLRHHAAQATGGASRNGAKARAKPRKLSPAERKRRKRGRAR
jgi:hypothetical protein